MELNLQAITQANKAGSISVSEAVFDAKFNMALIHQTVTAYLAAARSGTKAQKNRAAVSGGGAKPWRQKGTGRARAGTSRSPLWRSGGTTFAASPTSYEQKLNKKMYRGAMRSILSELNRQQRLIAVDSFSVNAPKTSELVSNLKSVGQDKTLIVVEAEDRNLFLAARNLGWVSVLTVDEVDPVSLVGVEKVIISMPALKRLEEKLS